MSGVGNIDCRFRQQIEILRREIVDQEKEYKNTIASLETKAHENWVINCVDSFVF